MRPLLGLLAASVVLASCIEVPAEVPPEALTPEVEATVGSDAEALGACDEGTASALPGQASGEVMPLIDRVRLTGGWFELDAEEAVEALEGALAGTGEVVTVELGTARRLAGEARAEVLAGRRSAERALTAATRGADIAVGADVQAEDPTDILVAMSDDGGAAFLGSCHFERYTEPLAAFAAHDGGGSPRELLVRLIQGDEEVATRIGEWSDPAPRRWVDLAPDRRLLDPEETPEEILDELAIVTVAVDVPDHWKDEPESLCTRVPELGWNECAALDLREPIQLNAYVDPRSPLEVWLLDPLADLRTPGPRVAVITAEQIRQATSASTPLVVLVQLDEDAPTTESLRSGPRRSEPRDLGVARVVTLNQVEAARP